MIWFIYCAVFYLGSIVGSFLNVCIHRLPRGESIVSPPSHCPHCKAPIRPYHNVPIVSYLLLRGRCPSCGARISPRYLAVEILTATAFLGLYLRYMPDIPAAAIYTAFVSSLIVVFFIDLRYQIIPDGISIGGMIASVVASAFYPPLHSAGSWTGSIIASLAGLAAGGGIFWLIRLVGSKVFGKEAMGFGDVKLMAYIGALLGWKMVLLTTFFSSLTGSAVGAYLLATRRAGARSEVPFGPFLCLGAVVALLWGEQLVQWYLGLFY